MKNRLISLLILVILIGCEKETDLSLAQKRAIDAEYNSKITPGVGNVFFEKELLSNTDAQLVFKIAYNKDTLAAYGKINELGKLEYIHTTILMAKGGSEMLVTETYPSISISRMYTIVNNIRSKILVETSHFGPGKHVISIVERNWSTGEEKVLLSTLIDDGVKKGEFSGLRAKDAWNCDQPQPAQDIDKTVDNHLEYHACGGLAWDTHPTLSVTKQTITSSLEKIKKSEQYQANADEINLLEKQLENIRGLYASIEGGISGYKFENTRLSGLLKQLEQLINELKEKKHYTVELVAFEAGTDTDYDEITDNEVKVTFLLNDLDTGLPFVIKPVYVDLAFLLPGSNTAIDIQSKATSPNNGMVTFKFDPKAIANYESISSLEMRWDLSSNSWSKSKSRNVTLKYIKPKVVFKDGNAITEPIKFSNGQTKIFKLVNEDGREITADYNNVTLNNSTNLKVQHTMLKGNSDFSIHLYTNESSIQNTSFDIYYNSKRVQTIGATVIDSAELYQVSAIGKYTVNNFKGNGPNSRLFCELKAGGVATYTIFDDPSWPDGYSWNRSWGIARIGSNYHMSISGWYNGYPSSRADAPLRYPVSSFLHHLDNLYTK